MKKSSPRLEKITKASSGIICRSRSESLLPFAWVGVRWGLTDKNLEERVGFTGTDSLG